MTIILVPHNDFHKNNTTTNNYNINIGDNSNINAINAQNATDNSSSIFCSIPPDFFDHISSLIKEQRSEHEQDLLDMINKIKTAKEHNDKKNFGYWVGKFISLSFLADCVTLAQAIYPALMSIL